MNPQHALVRAVVLSVTVVAAISAQAQFDGPPPGGGAGPGGPGGFGGPGGGFGGGGRGGPMGQQEIKLVERFDKNGDHWLNTEERKAAREFVTSQRANQGGGRGGFGGRGGRGGGQGPATSPGPKMSPADVKSASNADFFDPNTFRTLFFEFENADWEKELVDFHKTDVEVPAKLTVDGKVYKDVGLHFRGMSSYMMIGDGQKRSLNVSMDYIHTDQKLAGHTSFNLLNAHEDPSFQRNVLYSTVVRDYIPAPKANLVRVVINGEYWGVYSTQQHFNKEFIKENFGTTKGARWKVPGSPGGRGGLEYLGEDISAYSRIYELKTKEDPKAWKALIKLTKTLAETPPEKLEAALKPILDVDGALKFLALENVFVNNDGYWIRASDYSLYLDEKGKIHVLPHDMNEVFSRPGGPGFGGRGGRGGRGGPGGQGGFGGPGGPGGPGGFAGGPGQGGPGGGGQFGGPGGPGQAGQPGGPGGQGGQRGGGGGFGGGRGGIGGGSGDLDPLVAANDASKALLNKLLAVPALRQRYLKYVHDIADKWLDWSKLGPIAERNYALIAESVKIDTRKLESTADFLNSVKGETTAPAAEPGGFGPGRTPPALKTFVEERRAYLLKYKEPAAATK